MFFTVTFQAMKDAQVSHAEVVEFRQAQDGTLKTGDNFESMDMGVSKNGGTPKLDGENNGKPYSLMDDLGVPLF